MEGRNDVLSKGSVIVDYLLLRAFSQGRTIGWMEGRHVAVLSKASITSAISFCC